MSTESSHVRSSSESKTDQVGKSEVAFAKEMFQREICETDLLLELFASITL